MIVTEQTPTLLFFDRKGVSVDTGIFHNPNKKPDQEAYLAPSRDGMSFSLEKYKKIMK